MNKYVGVWWVLGCLLLASCGDNANTSRNNRRQFIKPLPNGNTAHLTGYQLAQAYCGSCHLFPAPALLDKQTWRNGVLPNMALRLGLDLDGTNPYVGMHFEEIPVVTQAGVFALEPLISPADWAKIVNYYDSAAPVHPLPQQPVPPIKNKLALFDPKPLIFKPRRLPLTTLAKVSHNRLFIGDKANNLFILDHDFNLLDSIRLESPAADLQINTDGSINVLTLGTLEPSDRSKGSLTRYKPSRGTYQAQPILQGLNRPVAATYAHLNPDQLPDIIICNYGNHTGNLAWYQNKDHGQYAKQLLNTLPGARQVIVQDFNHDGRPDIMALMAQASESITIYYNQGHNQFEEKQVLRFPPVYGSSYLEVADFNDDGHLDILYTNGDNADFSVSLKKYHGIRIFLNDGRNNFKQAWFYPLHGASKAIARDFDQDGDLDIAAIAFFPDFQEQPLNGFHYLQNTGRLKFTAATFPGAATGHWLTLEAGDVDQDGDQDLVLGSFVAAPARVPTQVQRQWLTAGPNALILVNKLKSK